MVSDDFTGSADNMSGGTPLEEAEKPLPPVQFEIVPDELSCLINSYEMQRGEKKFSCWSYLSEGLARIGQKELAILIVKREQESLSDYPLDPLGFFLTVKEFAQSGQYIMEGDITEFGEPGFIDRRFKGMSYIKPIGISGVADLESILSCVALTSEELEITKQFGLTRMIAMLGHQLSHYPCPPWVDRDRGSIVDGDMKASMENSIIAKVPQFKVPGLRAALSGDTVSIKCQRGTEPLLHELISQIPPEAPVVLQGELDPGSNALLVWQEDSSGGPSAITPPGSDGANVCAASVLIFPEQDRSGPQVIEDAFLLGFKTDDWTKLRNGFLTGTNQSVSVAGGGRISIEWYDSVLESVALSPKRELLPLPLIVSPDGAGEAIDARWLSKEEEILSAIDPRLANQFAEATQLTIFGYFVDRPEPQELLISVVCELDSGGKISWRFEGDNAVDELVLKGVELRLRELPIPLLSGGPISFELKIKVGGSIA